MTHIKVLVTSEDERAGVPGKCFYCKAPMGDEHLWERRARAWPLGSRGREMRSMDDAESPYGKITVEVLHWGAPLRGQECWPHKRLSELSFAVRARESLRTVLACGDEEVEVRDWGVVADALESAAETIKRLELRLRKLEEG